MHHGQRLNVSKSFIIIYVCISKEIITLFDSNYNDAYVRARNAYIH